MIRLHAIAASLKQNGVAHVFVHASQSGNVEFDGTIWGMIDNGVDDRFVGVSSKKLYVKFLFDEETVQDLSEQGYVDLVKQFVGSIFIFKQDDTDEEPEAVHYYESIEELNNEYETFERKEGGREDDDAEDTSEDDDADAEEDLDSVVWELVDGDVGCDAELGDTSSESGWYGLFRFDEDTKQFLIDSGYEESIEGLEGAIVYYNESGEDAEESIDYYANGDLDEAWEETKKALQ
jgi:hypothetical protein